MSGNTSAKKALIKRYGPKCFIESLKLRDTSHITYKGKAQRARMKALTYHHIRERVFGGKATVENGALLSAEMKGLDRSLGFFIGVLEGFVLVTFIIALLKYQTFYKCDALLENSLFNKLLGNLFTIPATFPGFTS